MGSPRQPQGTAVLERALRAMADPRRREILEIVRGGERSAGEIAAEFDVSRPAISQHLAILVDAELVTVTQRGTRRLYRARPEGLYDLREYIDSFWTEHLARLKAAAEDTTRRRRRR